MCLLTRIYNSKHFYCMQLEKKMSSPYFYDCGVEIAADGTPGKSNYSQRHLTLRSLHLLLWANFSLLCISLLTQKDVTLSSKVLSRSLPERQYCLMKMRAAWLHMQCSTVEKTSYFVMRSCQELIEVRTSSLMCLKMYVFFS